MSLIKMRYRPHVITVILLAAILAAAGCTPSTPVGNSTVSPTFSPSPVQSYSVSELSPNKVSVQLPPGWARVDQPELGIPTSHIEGIVAFNSWGNQSFCATVVRTGNHYEYSPETILQQVKDGGAYVILQQTITPPIPPSEPQPTEYAGNDLYGLWKPFDTLPEPQFISFYKWGKPFGLVIVCDPNASEETIRQLNDLLASWRFQD